MPDTLGHKFPRRVSKNSARLRCRGSTCGQILVSAGEHAARFFIRLQSATQIFENGIGALVAPLRAKARP